MKSYIISVIVVVTVIGCVLSEDILSRTERGARRQNRRAGCKYNKNPKVSPCDTVTNTYNKTFTLKKGRADCNSTMVISKPCKDSAGGCKYKNDGPWSDCDPVTKMKTKTKILKDGSGPSCPKTMKKTKPCSNDRRKGRKSKPCKYTKGDWSECDTTTNMRKRILTLKKGDRDVCESKKTVLKKCRKGNMDATNN